MFFPKRKKAEPIKKTKGEIIAVINKFFGIPLWAHIDRCNIAIPNDAHTAPRSSHCVDTSFFFCADQHQLFSDCVKDIFFVFLNFNFFHLHLPFWSVVLYASDFVKFRYACTLYHMKKMNAKSWVNTKRINWQKRMFIWQNMQDYVKGM